MNETDDENDYIRRTLRQSMPDDLAVDVEQRMHKRLAAFCKQVDTTAPSEPLEPARPWSRMTQWMGGLSMKKRIGIAFGGTAALLALLLLWGGDMARPVSAMEKMAESVRKAKSYKSTITSISRWRETPPKGASTPGPLVIRRTTQTCYHLADGSQRTETLDQFSGGFYPGGIGPTAKVTWINPAGKPWTALNHQTKTYRRYPPAERDSFMDEVQSLGSFAGRADRELGIKEIDGTKARGFQFDDASKLLPHNSPPETIADVWIDIESNLPIRLHQERKKKVGDIPEMTCTFNIQWNLDFDAKLFDATPPEGYTDVTSSMAVPPKSGATKSGAR